MNGNEFGGPGWNRELYPPAFAGRVDSSSKGHGPLREGLCPGIRLETALGISRGRTVPSECPYKNRKYDRPLIYNPKKHLR